MSRGLSSSAIFGHYFLKRFLELIVVISSVLTGNGRGGRKHAEKVLKI